MVCPPSFLSPALIVRYSKQIMTLKLDIYVFNSKKAKATSPTLMT